MRSSHRLLAKFNVLTDAVAQQHSERNRFTSGPLRSNESHISLLSTALRSQLTSILRAKKNQITVATIQVKDIDYKTLRIVRRMRFNKS